MNGRYDAVLFDLDGVLTSTASAHARCSKAVFDEVLDGGTRRNGEPQKPFDVEREYLAHVDGKPRQDGVRDFLQSRGIDGCDVDAIADRKQMLVEEALAREGVEAFPGSVQWVLHLRRTGVRTARRLGVAPTRAVVVEDALAGVAAGRDGDFGLVIGVARSAAHEDLRSAGADIVVDDLGDLLP